jgi:hypothetical protein
MSVQERWRKVQDWLVSLSGGENNPYAPRPPSSQRPQTPQEMPKYFTPTEGVQGTGGPMISWGDVGRGIAGAARSLVTPPSMTATQQPAQVAQQPQSVTGSPMAGQPQAPVNQPYGGLTGEDLIFQAQMKAFGGGSGIYAGAGDPEQNAARYRSALEQMAQTQELTRPMSTAGRAEAREQRSAERRAMVQAARAGGREGGRAEAQATQRDQKEAADQAQKRVDSATKDFEYDVTTTFEQAVDAIGKEDTWTPEQKARVQQMKVIVNSPSFKRWQQIHSANMLYNEEYAKAYNDTIGKYTDPDLKLQAIINHYKETAPK